MDKKTALQTRVGVFVTLGLFLTMLVIFFLSGDKNFFERDYVLQARFQDISGLRIGAPVFLAGLSVGLVDDIDFPKALEEQDIIVKLKIIEKYRNRIREDSTATIATQGLLGDKIILISVGSINVAEMKPGNFLKTKKGFSIDNFTEKGGELLDRLTKLAKNVDDVVVDVKTKKSLVHSLIYDSRGETVIPNIVSMTESGESILKQIRVGHGVLHAFIYDSVDRDFAKNISKTVSHMKNSSENIESVTGKIDRGEGSLGGLINDPTVYYDLKTLLGKANRSKLLKAVIRHTLSQNEKSTLKQ